MPIIQVPPATNYNGVIAPVALPQYNDSPPEGQRIANMSVNWGTQGGPGNAVSFNLGFGQTLAFSQICSLIVDNSQCGCDVQFVFPDTGVTETIAAYTPYAVVPALTAGQFFYLVGVNPAPEDTTNFSVTNFIIPPVVVPGSQEQEVSAPGIISAGTVAATQLIPANVNGSVETLFGTFFSGTTAGAGDWKIQDGTGKVLAQGGFNSFGTIVYFATFIDLQNVRIRFNQGVQFLITSTDFNVSAGVNLQLYYRTP